MQTTHKQTDLAHALQTVTRTTDKHSPHPTHQGIHLTQTPQTTTLHTNNGNIETQTTLPNTTPNPTNTNNTHTALTPAEPLTQTIKAHTHNTITLQTNTTTNQLQITANTATTHLDTYRPHNYPPPTNIDTLPLQATLTSQTLATILHQVTPAAAPNNNTHPHLAGIHIQTTGRGHTPKLTITATDSYRIAQHTTTGTPPIETAQDLSLMIPTQTIQHLQRIIGKGDKHQPIHIHATDTKIGIEHHNTRIFSRLITSDPPNLKNITPTTWQGTYQINRHNLINAIQHVAPIARPHTPTILTINTNTLTITATTPDLGTATDTLPITNTENTPLTIGFHHQYLLDGLTALTSETITLQHTGPTGIAQLTGNDDQLTYLIMPIKPAA